MILAFLPIFALADRFAGGPWAGQWRLPVRPVAVSLAFLLLTLPFLLHGWQGVALAFGWAFWRWFGWKMTGGKIDPRTPAEIGGYFVRHLFALPAGLALGHWGVPAMAVFAVIATGLGVVLAKYADKGRDVNAWIEAARGAVFGACVIGGLA